MRSGSRPLGALLGLALVLFVLSCTRTPDYPRPLAGGAVRGVSIRAETLKEGVPSFYSFEDGQKKINFFVLRMDGRIETYLDACLKCNPKKLGYAVEGDRLRCRACGETYGLGHLQDGVGSCRPIPLKGSLEGDDFLISPEETLKGRRYF